MRTKQKKEKKSSPQHQTNSFFEDKGKNQTPDTGEQFFNGSSLNSLLGIKRGDGLNFGTWHLRPLVKLLQRTLNKKIDSFLAIDGMFGPLTGKALEKFQTVADITPKQLVDASTITALASPKGISCGPLLFSRGIGGDLIGLTPSDSRKFQAGPDIGLTIQNKGVFDTNVTINTRTARGSSAAATVMIPAGTTLTFVDSAKFCTPFFWSVSFSAESVKKITIPGGKTISFPVFINFDISSNWKPGQIPCCDKFRP
ncbi:peptidoglycan-binding protein [Sungkyunkwania multivorans]|uniref:Peptidoglycan-binding protein n=1 Tax=Sungkyunkwania multivorans TaxID=1173618 RepID=A0ABW3CY04_9FLAO